jgi:PAS domain S-box-containing protein
MKQTAKSPQWTQIYQDWEERKSPDAWKIEAESPTELDYIPFFPDQNGKVYELMLYNMPIILHSMDGMGRLSSANKSWMDAFGFGRSEVVGKLFPDFLTPDSRNNLIQNIYPRYFQTGHCRNEELVLLRKDGTIAHVLLSMNAYRGERGRIDRSICVMQDITARRIAEIASKRSEQRFRGAFESAAHGMAIVAPTGRIVKANSAFKTMLGRAEFSDSIEFESLLHGDDREPFLEGMRNLLSGDSPSLQAELRYEAGGGMELHGFTSVAVVRDEHRNIDQLVIQIVDVSTTKRAQIQLQHAQKMEAVGQLTGGLAHDFNNLLTVIMGNLQLIEFAVKDNPKAKKRTEEAIDAAKKGSDLTAQLLAFAKKQPLAPQDVQINGLVRSVEPLIARTIGETIELRCSLMPGEPQALIDASRLESAILNLCINARDAMPEGGRLTIETASAYLDDAYCARHADLAPGHYVMIAVSDTGSGIPAELLEKVFQPFFTTKPPGRGSGLGLAMVYGFIKQSGGHIQVYSEMGRGTAIKLYLPRILGPGEAVPQAAAHTGGEPPAPAAAVELAPLAMLAMVEPEPAPAPARNPRILVVEDQEAVREVACGFLTEFGYDIVEAEDGFQALAKLQENEDIDLMFTDVVMPGGMNGFDLAQAAYSLRPELKVVHTSGYPKGAMVHQEEPRFREGFIIMKPYRREDLQRMISEALASRAPSP